MVLERRVWLLSVELRTAEQAGKSIHRTAMLSKKAFGCGDFDIVLMIGVFLKFGHQVAFGLSGMEQRVTAQLSDEDAACGVVFVIACMNTDTLEAGHIVDQRQHATELGRPGERQFVPSERDATFRVRSVGNGRRFKSTAEGFTSDEEDACGLVRRLVSSDKR